MAQDSSSMVRKKLNDMKKKAYHDAFMPDAASLKREKENGEKVWAEFLTDPNRSDKEKHPAAYSNLGFFACQEWLALNSPVSFILEDVIMRVRFSNKTNHILSCIAKNRYLDERNLLDVLILSSEESLPIRDIEKFISELPNKFFEPDALMKIVGWDKREHLTRLDEKIPVMFLHHFKEIHGLRDVPDDWVINSLTIKENFVKV